MNPSGVNRSRQKVFKESKLVATKMNNKDLANELGTVKDWVNPLVTQSITILKDTNTAAYATRN
jgi:hypothetical protein